MSDAAVPVPLKEMLNPARYRAIADQLAGLNDRFNSRVFLELTLNGLRERTLMERIRQTSIAANASLPGTYQAKLRVLRKLAPQIEHNFVSIFLPDFVAQFGLSEIDLSLNALKFFTPFGSSEFGVRPFLARDQKRVMKEMVRWAHDSDEHVRRLASEGCRPRLPWGQRLPELIRDPSPIAPILEMLKDDPSLYVRKSVANNLNDIAKDHRDWVLDLIESWNLEIPGTGWIAKRGLRTLIKDGHPRALGLLGVNHGASVTASIEAAPKRLRLGDTLRLRARIDSQSETIQQLIVDYVIHYQRPNGRISRKVFKWKGLDLHPGTHVRLAKSQRIQDFTTRKHHAGRHMIDLQVNGVTKASTEFTLRI